MMCDYLQSFVWIFKEVVWMVRGLRMGIYNFVITIESPCMVVKDGCVGSQGPLEAF